MENSLFNPITISCTPICSNLSARTHMHARMQARCLAAAITKNTFEMLWELEITKPIFLDRKKGARNNACVSGK